MDLIRVGGMVLNLSLLIHADIDDGEDGEEVSLRFSGRDDILVLDGEEAEAVRKHLIDAALDLTPATPADQEYALFRGRGGTMPRADWDGLRESLRSTVDRGGEWTQRDFDRAAAIEAQLLV